MYTGFGFSASGTEGNKPKAREGPTENLTKPSRRRAEKDDTNQRGVFFCFCFYCTFGGWEK